MIELVHVFEAQGYSGVFTSHGSFMVAVNITTGTNVVTLEEEIGSVWQAVTLPDGESTEIAGNAVYNVERFAGGKFRWNCGTFDTGPVRCTAKGRELNANDTFGAGAIYDLLDHDGDEILDHNGERIIASPLAA